MIPLSFRNAIIDPENVIAPIAAPKDISIKLAKFMLPTIPKLKASGFKNADIAENCQDLQVMKSCDQFRHRSHWNSKSYKYQSSLLSQEKLKHIQNLFQNFPKTKK